jgi:hypothetical protein
LGQKTATQSTYHKEALAILLALTKWRHYFLGGSPVIRIDHQTIKYMKSQKLTEGIRHKLLLKLLEFDCKIEYKKGAKNVAADALSRKEHSLLAISTATLAWISNIEASYQGDGFYSPIIEHVLVNPTTSLNYFIHSDILRFKGRICIGQQSDLRDKILATLHSSAIGGHSGIRVTYQRIKRIFHWPNLKKDVDLFVTQCVVCQRAKSKHYHYPGLRAPLPIPTLAWSFISLDFVEGLPKLGGKNVILVMVDKLTKYAHFLPLTHPFTAQTMAQTFMDQVFKLHGPPVTILIGRDIIFTSKLWKDLFKAMKVSLYYSSSYHSQTDGQTERVNQCLQNYLRCMAFLEQKKWSSWLPLAEWWYNTNFHTSLKTTPFEALYGYSPPMISEIMVPEPESPALEFLTQK